MKGLTSCQLHRVTSGQTSQRIIITWCFMPSQPLRLCQGEFSECLWLWLSYLTEELEAREGISLDITTTCTRGMNTAQRDSTRLMTTWVQFLAGVAGQFVFSGAKVLCWLLFLHLLHPCVTAATPLNHTLCSLPGDMFSSVTVATPLNHTLCSLPGDMFSSVTVATPLNHTLCSLPGDMFSSVTVATPLND